MLRCTSQCLCVCNRQIDLQCIVWPNLLVLETTNYHVNKTKTVKVLLERKPPYKATCFIEYVCGTASCTSIYIYFTLYYSNRI